MLRISEEACGTRTQGSWSLRHQATCRGTEKQALQPATCPSSRPTPFPSGLLPGGAHRIPTVPVAHNSCSVKMRVIQERRWNLEYSGSEGDTHFCRVLAFSSSGSLENPSSGMSPWEVSDYPKDRSSQAELRPLYCHVRFVTCCLASPESSLITHSLGWHPPLYSPKRPSSHHPDPQEWSLPSQAAEWMGSCYPHLIDGETEAPEQRARPKVTRSLLCFHFVLSREGGLG